MEIPEVKIVRLKVSDLKGWDKNPREIEDEDFEKLKEYISKYGILQTLTVDGRDGKTVLGGNMRLKALEELGVEEVNCSLPIPKNDDEAVEIAIIDNAKFGKYVTEKLLDLSKEYDIDLDLKISMGDISLQDLKLDEMNDLGDFPEGVGSDAGESDGFVLKLFFTDKEFYEQMLTAFEEGGENKVTKTTNFIQGLRDGTI